jgi:hypothetical protein
MHLTHRFHDVEPQPGLALMPPHRLSRAVVLGVARRIPQPLLIQRICIHCPFFSNVLLPAFSSSSPEITAHLICHIPLLTCRFHDVELQPGLALMPPHRLSCDVVWRAAHTPTPAGCSSTQLMTLLNSLPLLFHCRCPCNQLIYNPSLHCACCLLCASYAQVS